MGYNKKLFFLVNFLVLGAIGFADSASYVSQPVLFSHGLMETTLTMTATVVWTPTAVTLSPVTVLETPTLATPTEPPVLLILPTP